MKFAKYYDVSNFIDTMMKNQDIDCYPTGESKYKGVYVCMDTNDFWVSRILQGYNEEYEKDENKYLIERNKIDIYDVMEELHKISKKQLPKFGENDMYFERKNKMHRYFDMNKTCDIIKAVIILDDKDGLSNWDCCECNSLDEAIETIDGGYGILQCVS